VSPRSCTVSFTGASGVRHSVDVVAQSLYEAAALGLTAFRRDGWTEPIAPGTTLEVLVSQPETKHTVTIAQVRRWCEAVTVSPEETLKKRRVKELSRA
jgi:hypothetical protein